MKEPHSIEEVLEILKMVPPPTINFQKADAKGVREKNFSIFKNSIGLHQNEAAEIIKNLTKAESIKEFSDAKMTERTSMNLEEGAHRWVFLHRHTYEAKEGHKTITIYIKLMIPAPNLILVESFHESLVDSK